MLYIMVVNVKFSPNNNKIIQNYPILARPRSSTWMQDSKSRTTSPAAKLLKNMQVLLVILLQSHKTSSSMFLQFCEKVLSASSSIPWHPLRFNVFKNPPHRRDKLWTTWVYIGKNKSKSYQSYLKKLVLFHIMFIC